MSDQQMMTTTTTTLDVVFCLDCSGSIISYMNQIRATILSILLRVPDYGEGNIRLALIEFRSDRANPTTRIHQFTSSVQTLREWLENVTSEGGCVEDSKAVGKEKHLSLWSSDFDWFFSPCIDCIVSDGLAVRCKCRIRCFSSAISIVLLSLQVDSDLYHEKLVILLTDGPPCGLLNSDCSCESEDLWKVMNHLEEKQVTVAVVGVEPNVNICRDFYGALAERTGTNNSLSLVWCIDLRSA